MVTARLQPIADTASLLTRCIDVDPPGPIIHRVQYREFVGSYVLRAQH